MVLPADKWQQVYDHITAMNLTDPGTAPAPHDLLQRLPG
jgi:hypothetical protein